MQKNNIVSCLWVPIKFSKAIKYLFFALCQKVTNKIKQISEKISRILAKIETNPAIVNGISLESPIVIIPSLMPMPIGAITDRYPDIKDSTKNPIRLRVKAGDK